MISRQIISPITFDIDFLEQKILRRNLHCFIRDNDHTQVATRWSFFVGCLNYVDVFLHGNLKQNKMCFNLVCRGGSRTAATSKMERFVINVAAVLDPPLVCLYSSAEATKPASVAYKQTNHKLTCRN